MFKNLLFDIDNTIFNFHHAEQIALEKIFQKLEKETNYSYNHIKETYLIQKKIFQNHSGVTGSSHCKFLQLKTLFDKLSISLNQLHVFSEYYDDEFKKNILLYPKCEEFLRFCRLNNINLYCLSNNTSKEQIDRIKHTGLLDLFNTIYTSEEFGIEKPDSKLYNHILSLINGSNNDTAMIGDSFTHDISGPNYINMFAFWLQDENCFTNKYIQFHDYQFLLELFQEYFHKTKIFIELSKKMGERFDLVQAGGGNSSFKMKDYMFIKSSGCGLSEITMYKNYVGIQYVNIKNGIHQINDENKRNREKNAANLTNNEIVFYKQYKPSIETTMHTLTNTYTIHLHPIQFNKISALKDCKKIISHIFPNSCFIDYFTPGIDVALQLHNIYKNESIIFLKNHGIVFTHENPEILQLIIEDTMIKLENYLDISFDKYKFVNTLSNIMEIVSLQPYVSYLSEDRVIENYINNNNLTKHLFKSFFPDKVVYCGNDFVLIDENVEESLEINIKNYIHHNGEIPKIFIKKNEDSFLCYICSNSLKKCLEIESVLKSHLLCYQKNNELLTDDEIQYLNNWDAEKYRKSL